MQDLGSWTGQLHVGYFPLLWSWSGKSSQSHAERWSPLHRIYPQRKAPSSIALGGAEWLCATEHMRDAVTQAFEKRGDVPVVPQEVCRARAMAFQRILLATAYSVPASSCALRLPGSATALPVYSWSVTFEAVPQRVWLLRRQ